jgi:hypothetical protein
MCIKVLDGHTLKTEEVLITPKNPPIGKDAATAKPLATDELWEVIEPLLPEESPKPKGGRPRVPDRAALVGVLFVLKGASRGCYPRRWAAAAV